ncbi:MAG: shikimate dehydrogenase [Nanoarchaeota archaeon]|nr:shikimate dehydrogenase [Nanoarchaeota archaeon]
MSRIVLIGFRGSGKSTVAKLLAKRLGLPLISTDREFVKRNGTIERFVKRNGWKTFRDEESAIVRALASCGIVDCGGGVVERKENLNPLKAGSEVFFLNVSEQELARRLKRSPRPALTAAGAIQEIQSMLLKRTPLYKKTADFEVRTEGKTSSDVAKEIARIHSLRGLCTVIVPKNEREIDGLMAHSRQTSCVEIRLDNLKSPILPIKKPKGVTLIATCRTPSHGGSFTGSEESRLKMLESVGANFIDVEFGTSLARRVCISKRKSGVILSHHISDRTPSLKSLQTIYKRMKALKPDAIKIVTTTKSIDDVFTVFELLKGKKDLIAFCMGEKGILSRVLAFKFGSRLSYLRLSQSTAPGQLDFKEMESCNADLMTSETRILGIIGTNVSHSLSKRMHNPLFKRKCLDSAFVPFDVGPKELTAFMKNFRKCGFAGAAVTHPHKENVMVLLDELDDVARRIGAVNTLVNRNGKLAGFNTDAEGAVRALEERTSLPGKRALIFGAGGAARAIAFGLKEAGAHVTLVNRSDGKARHVAKALGVHAAFWKDKGRLMERSDILINATPVGMDSDESVVEQVPRGKLVMDIIYRPRMTAFLRKARVSECTIITGERMLIHQAVRQFELWTEKKTNARELERALKRRQP